MTLCTEKFTCCIFGATTGQLSVVTAATTAGVVAFAVVIVCGGRHCSHFADNVNSSLQWSPWSQDRLQ